MVNMGYRAEMRLVCIAETSSEVSLSDSANMGVEMGKSAWAAVCPRDPMMSDKFI